jgi:uncharacterized protein DUF6941
MLLADAAQVAEGKLYIMGGGWEMCGPEPTPMALAVKVEIPPSQVRRKHTWSITLVDANGEPVLLTADGEKSTVTIHGEFGRIADLKSLPKGGPVHLRFALNVAPLPLEPGTSYAWRLSIDNQTRRDWQVSFSTRPITAPSD